MLNTGLIYLQNQNLKKKIKEILIEAQERIERRKLLPIDKTQKQIDYFYDSKDDDSEDN